jgi:hypothetical protein
MQSTLMLLPVNSTSRVDIACMLGSTSRTETAASPKATNSSVMAGSTSFNAHMKSLAGSIPSDKLTGGKVHADPLTVALNVRTAEPGPKKGCFAKTTSTFALEKDDTSSCLTASRMLMPASRKVFRGDTSLGGLGKSNVKHVSRY